MKKIFILSAMITTAFSFVSPVIFTAHADNLTVLPAVIDGSGVPNDILSYSLTVTNTSGRQQNIFATVCELTPSGTVVFANPSVSDAPVSLADWLSVSRAAILLQPGESTTTPVTVQISPYAVAGDYHATIAFVAGDTRFDATQNLDGAPQALINVSVASGLTASMRVDGFAPTKGLYTGFPVAFNYIIENTGQVTSTPSGEVMFYDHLGRELGSVNANPDNVSIVPGAKQSFTALWQNGGNLGQYKAVLDISYGTQNDRLENTALVWVLPLKKLIVIFSSLFLAMIILALWLHHGYAKRHRRRRQAIEHLLKRGKQEEPKSNIKTGDHVLDLRHHHD